MIFIFLSNRITPSAENKKLFKTKLRSRIHSLVYEALGSYESLSASLAIEANDPALPDTLLVVRTPAPFPIENCEEEEIIVSRK